jgi:tight adherence protein B
VQLLGHTPASLRSVVVLSDGADAGSHGTPAEVIEAARRTQTRVFGFGLRSGSYDGSALTHLAQRTGGRYADSGRRELTQLFAALSRRFDREFVVSYRSLAPASARVGVRIQVAGIPGAATAAYTAPALPAVARARDSSRPTSASGIDLWVVVALAALLAGAAVFLVVRSGRPTVAARIADFTTPELAFAADALTAQGIAADAELSARPRRVPSRRWAAFAEDVDVAGFETSPERIAVWTAAGTVLAAAAALALGNPVLALLALPAPVVARMVVSARAGAARRKFEAQLADNLQIVASAMRAGQTFAGALAVAVEDASEPAKRELYRSVVDERLGVPLDEAIGRVARRMRNEELDYVGLVATLQRETGGSTAEVLDRITQTIRERAELRRLVRGLTAQGRLGGGVVTAIPPALAAVFAVTQPGYFDPLLHNAFGVMCLGLGVAMLTVGWISIRKIVDIEV